MEFRHILNDEPHFDFDFDFDSSGLTTRSAVQLSPSNYPLIYPDTPGIGSIAACPIEIDFDDFLLASQDATAGGPGHGSSQFSSGDLHQIEIGLEDWANVMQQLPQQEGDHNASSGPEPTPDGDGDAGDGVEPTLICYGMVCGGFCTIIYISLFEVLTLRVSSSTSMMSNSSLSTCMTWSRDCELRERASRQCPTPIFRGLHCLREWNL